MNMHHLGPLHNDRNVSLGGSDTATQSNPAHVNPDVNERFESLQYQVESIREPRSAVQVRVDEGNNLTDQLTRQNDEQTNTVTSLKDLQSSEQFTYDETVGNVDRLRFEAQQHRDAAHIEKDEQLIRWNLDEAKRKEEEALLEEERAKVMFDGIEARVLEIDTQSRTQQNIETALNNTTSNTYNSTRTYDDLSAQSSNLTSKLPGTSPQGRATSSSSTSYLSASRSSLGASNELGASTTLGASGGPGTEFVVAAIELLKQIAQVVGKETARNITSPIGMLAKNLTVKSLSEDAKAVLEAAQVAAALLPVATNQQIILLMSMANTLHGDAVTNVAFWKEVLKDNNKMVQMTHELAKPSA